MSTRKEVKIDKTAELLLKEYSDPNKNITSSKRAFEIFNIMLNNAYEALSLAYVEHRNIVGPPIDRAYIIEKELYYVYNEKKGLFASKVIPINIMKASTLAEVVGPLRKFKLDKTDVKQFNESFVRNLKNNAKNEDISKYPAVVFFRAYLKAISFLTYSSGVIWAHNVNNLSFNGVKFNHQELNKLIINKEMDIGKVANLTVNHSLPYDVMKKRFKLDLFSVYGLDPYNITDLEYIIRGRVLHSDLEINLYSDRNSMQDFSEQFRKSLEIYNTFQPSDLNGSFLNKKGLPFNTYIKIRFKKVKLTLYSYTGGLGGHVSLKADNIDAYFDY